MPGGARSWSVPVVDGVDSVPGGESVPPPSGPVPHEDQYRSGSRRDDRARRAWRWRGRAGRNKSPTTLAASDRRPTISEAISFAQLHGRPISWGCFPRTGPIHTVLMLVLVSHETGLWP